VAGALPSTEKRGGSSSLAFGKEPSYLLSLDVSQIRQKTPREEKKQSGTGEKPRGVTSGRG